MSSPDSGVGKKKARGSDALFGAPRCAGPTGAGPAVAGRHALFSAPPRRRGCVVVECQRCQARTPVPFIEMFSLLPAIWVPGRRFSRFLRCPACRAFTWTHVEWRALLTG